MQKNQSRPYHDNDLPSASDWEAIPRTNVAIRNLVPTQYYLVIDRLIEIRRGSPPEGGDIPHIVCSGGVLYIHDGHHRISLDALIGVTHLNVRIFNHYGTTPTGETRKE